MVATSTRPPTMMQPKAIAQVAFSPMRRQMKAAGKARMAPMMAKQVISMPNSA